MADDIKAQVTINEKTRVPLSFVGWVSGFVTSFLLGAVIWGVRQESRATQAMETAAEAKADVKGIREDVRVIREAQIRMEASMGLHPSYFIDTKKKTEEKK